MIFIPVILYFLDPTAAAAAAGGAVPPPAAALGPGLAPGPAGAEEVEEGAAGAAPGPGGQTRRTVGGPLLSLPAKSHFCLPQGAKYAVTTTTIRFEL